jgi:hypothetical protein
VPLLARLVQRLVLQAPQEPNAVAVAGMALEALTMLCNPAICLNPAAPRPVKLSEETPGALALVRLRRAALCCAVRPCTCAAVLALCCASLLCWAVL